MWSGTNIVATTVYVSTSRPSRQRANLSGTTSLSGRLSTNSCSAPVAQLTTELEFYRKLDWPGPWSGIISDSVWNRSSGDGVIISTFSTAPFGAFNPPNDVGDVYGVDANTGNAVALKTRDGSLRADLYFVGENCGGGGTGWVLFGRGELSVPVWLSIVQPFRHGDQRRHSQGQS
jgi:hypothetical protein